MMVRTSALRDVGLSLTDILTYDGRHRRRGTDEIKQSVDAAMTVVSLRVTAN